MKKVIALLLVFILCLSLCACGSKKEEEAFNASREAFNKITEVYAKLDEYSQDIYMAFHLGENSPGSYDGYKGYDFEK